MAGFDDLKNEIGEAKKLIDELKGKNINIDTRPLEDALKRVQSNMQGVGTEAAKSADKLKESMTSSSYVIANVLGGVNSLFGRLAQSILDSGRGAAEYGEQFRRAFAGTGIDEFAAGFDELTEMTRGLRTSAVDLGSAFGLSFDQVKGSYQDYIASVILAQENTYLNRQAIQAQTVELGRLGIGLDEVSRTFTVAGTQQNMLSEGFLLSADTGLRTGQTFSMMAQAARTMGLSIEDSSKPLVAIENIAKATGLPIQDLADNTFKTAQQFARLGLTVDGMGPIIRRFTDALGSGFKGLAIDETTNIIKGLERQINTTQAAFIAMQGGLSRPGAGVAEAQLAFEDAFKNPVEIMKSLGTTLAGVTGGKILRFEEARANPELANQFKIQRDLLMQMTGTDVQSARTLLSVLGDLQSGRQLSATQNKTVEDALKSGTQKQEEQRSLQERIGKAQVGLLTQIALQSSAFFERRVPAQAQAALVNEGRNIIQDKGAEIFNKALEMGSKLLENNLPEGVKKFARGADEAYTGFVQSKETNAAELRKAPGFTVPGLTSGTNPVTIPDPLRPVPFLPAPPPPGSPGASTVNQTTKTTTAPGERNEQHIIVTFRGTDELTRAIADAAAKSHNKSLHGGG